MSRVLWSFSVLCQSCHAFFRDVFNGFCQIVILCDHGVLQMLDLFLHFDSSWTDWSTTFYFLWENFFIAWFVVNNLILLMWAFSFVDLHCIVVHAFKHVIGERDFFLLDHVIELFTWHNNIQMITWLNFDAYILHLDSPFIILASIGCLWCGPSCFILACLHIILFLNPMNGILNETSALVHEPSFQDSIIGS